MKTQCIQEQMVFQQLGRREVMGRFDGGMISSDGGGMLLREVERCLGILKRFAGCFRDYRDPQRTEHSLQTLIRQRVYGIALGYEDLNDHDRLRQDVMMGVLCEKSDPRGMERARKRDQGKGVAGKSTLNRLELTPEQANEKSRYKKIVAHGDQIDDLMVEVCIQAQPIAPQDAASGVRQELELMVKKLRAAWPEVRIVLRGDSGFCREEIMSYCEQNEKVDYVLGLAKNDRLNKGIEAEMAQAQQLQQQTQKASRVFKDFRYRTRKSWSCERRVVGKAEYLAKGANPRFIVTSIASEEKDARTLYEDFYCARGDMENRIKEQQLGLFADRTSTAWMRSNQLRLYFSSFAYILMQTLRRLGLQGTELAQAQCDTIRLKLFKIGAQIEVTVRKVWISFSESYPYLGLFQRVFARLQQIPSGG